ncbi:unnamed protein product, partial [Laminaria digitata]
LYRTDLLTGVGSRRVLVNMFLDFLLLFFFRFACEGVFLPATPVRYSCYCCVAGAFVVDWSVVPSGGRKPAAAAVAAVIAFLSPHPLPICAWHTIYVLSVPGTRLTSHQCLAHGSASICDCTRDHLS